MKQIITLSIVTVLALAACADPDSTRDTLAPGGQDSPPVTDDTTPGDPVPGPVFVDETELLVGESFPMQLFLTLQGNLPTPCHEPRWTVEETSVGVFEVTLDSLSTAEACDQALKPIELSIPLGTSEGGPIEVVLNGEVVHTSDLGGDDVSVSNPGGEAGPVFVDETGLLVAESFPMQLSLTVVGNLPTPCHEPQWEVVETSEGIFEVTLSSVSTGEECIQVLEPVELRIPLGTSEGGPIEVLLNGEVVQTADL